MRTRGARACWLAGALLAWQAGGAPTGASVAGALPGRGDAIDRLNAASMRGVPPVPPAPVVRPDMVWVPDRWVPIPGEPGGVLVPGHWEQRVGERQFRVPPVTVVKPGTGAFETFPAGVKPPPDARSGP